MKYLAIDTCNENLTVIAKNGNKEEIFFDANCGVNHSERLMPEIENALEKTGLKLKDLDFVSCVIGAGSFTGIRIGLSTVKALCFSNNLPILKITSFDTLAYNIKSGKVLAVIDAGHNGYYVSGYENKKIILNPQYINKEELKNLQDEYLLISNKAIEDFNVKVVSVLNGLKIATEELKDNLDLDIENVTPLYLRKSQAEEGRP